ncbi:MAG: DUF349 domain-containing protein [Bacteroidota bacterium]
MENEKTTGANPEEILENIQESAIETNSSTEETHNEIEIQVEESETEIPTEVITEVESTPTADVTEAVITETPVEVFEEPTVESVSETIEEVVFESQAEIPATAVEVVESIEAESTEKPKRKAKAAVATETEAIVQAEVIQETPETNVTDILEDHPIMDLVDELHERILEGSEAMEDVSAADHHAVRQLIESSPELNYEDLGREDLIHELERVVQEEDLNQIKTTVALIKVSFLKITKEEKHQHLEAFLAEGGNKEEYEPAEDKLEQRFTEVFNIYKEKKAQITEEQEKQKLANLEAKKQILNKLRALITSEEPLNKTNEEFRRLQDEWKNTGMVPRTDANELWENYHFLAEKIYDRIKINNELRDLDLKKNLEIKIALCEKAEALLLETSILKTFKLLQQYHEEWREIGPVPQDKRDDIWNRFRDASNKINERRRDYYEEARVEQENNLMAKNALCDQAEKLVTTEITSLKLWQDLTDQLNELQKIWRTIGPAPKAKNDEIWHRFKGYIDSFFTQKKEFYNDIKEEQVHNYNVKLDLCVQAEGLKSSTDWKKTTQDLIHLQEEWRKVGPVPRKYSDKLWKRFRTACDEFFQAKSQYFSSLQETETDNLKKKEEMIKKVESHEYSDNKKENLEILNNYQREWMEIGHVPIKEKDRLNQEFRKSINSQLDKLKIGGGELNSNSYRRDYNQGPRDSYDNRGGGGAGGNREKVSLSQKIQQLQEEVNLWENNLGFLANSKNAAILREEFEKKIIRAKEEVKLLEAKLRMMRETQ